MVLSSLAEAQRTHTRPTRVLATSARLAPSRVVDSVSHVLTRRMVSYSTFCRRISLSLSLSRGWERGDGMLVLLKNILLSSVADDVEVDRSVE